MDQLKHGLPISLRRAIIQVRASFWFMPGLMVAAAIGLAILMIHLDRTLDAGIAERFPSIFGANASGARSILATIAGSMITVAGVIFSITIVALALASNQYSPRILRNFMRDSGNQVVLGLFVSVFVYCLIVLRAIRGGDESFIPSYSLLVGIALGISSIGFLIYFVHHIANMVQASTILANIYEETTKVIETLYPEIEKAAQNEKAQAQTSSTLLQTPTARHVRVLSTRSGYIQDVDEDWLFSWAEENDSVLEMACGIGAFVIAGTPLVHVHGRTEVDEKFAEELNKRFSISEARTTEQDPAFGIRQIVDVALKALSPGINDSTTASSCLDYLSAIIFDLSTRHIPASQRCTGSRVRLISCTATFESIVDEAFHEIRQHARDNVAIYVKLISTIEKAIAPRLSSEKADLLWRHAVLVAQSADKAITHAADRALISDALAKTALALQKDHRPYALSLAHSG